jgi:alkylhydroperoxidase family enzyme
MDDENNRKDLLHGPWPSLAEELSGRYGADWEIYREILPNGKHGDWIAERRPTGEGAPKLRAKRLELLADRLRDENCSEPW